MNIELNCSQVWYNGEKWNIKSRYEIGGYTCYTLTNGCETLNCIKELSTKPIYTVCEDEE